MFHGESISRSTGEVTSQLRGPIFCVTAIGNKAVIGFVVERSTNPQILEGRILYVPMVDNGRPGSELADLYGPYYLPPDATEPESLNGQCTRDFLAFMTVTDGDIIVHDGQLVGSA